MTDDELIYGYLDNGLDKVQEKALQKRLVSDSVFCRRFVEAARQQQLLGRQLKKECILNCMVQKPKSDRRVIKLSVIAAVAAMVLFCIGFVLLRTSGPVVQVVCQGVVQEIDFADLSNGSPLLDKGRSAVVILPDGSRLGLNENARMRLVRKINVWELELDKGEVSCRVVRLPAGEELIVRAADLSVKVVGTEFKVRRAGNVATVSVEKGEVLVGQGVKEKFRLKAGQLVNVSYVMGKVPAVSFGHTEWSASVASGKLPDNCYIGKVHKDGSGGYYLEALSASEHNRNKQLSSKGAAFYKKEGLFTYEEGLVLEFDYKLNRTGRWLGIWGYGDVTNTYYYDDIKAEYDKWTHVRFPLSRLRVQKVGEYKLEPGEVISRFIIMTQDDPDAELLLKNIKLYKEIKKP